MSGWAKKNWQIAENKLILPLHNYCNTIYVTHDKEESSEKAALNVLEGKELVYHSTQGYSVYNRFLELWLQRKP